MEEKPDFQKREDSGKSEKLPRKKGLLLLWRLCSAAEFYLCFQALKHLLTQSESLKQNLSHALFSPCILDSYLETLWSDLHKCCTFNHRELRSKFINWVYNLKHSEKWTLKELKLDGYNVWILLTVISACIRTSFAFWELYHSLIT